MVKTNNTKFSAASVAKGSVVLSKAIEKNFALEAEISRLRHHVSVPLQEVTCCNPGEKNIRGHCRPETMSKLPRGRRAIGGCGG